MQNVNNNNNNNNNNKRKIDDLSQSFTQTINEERDAIAREREQFENEKIAFEQNLKKVQLFHSSEPIQLNMGGKKFCTTLDTLTKFRDSFFGAMFSGYIALKPTKDGSYFIDRDGKNFHYILNFLRTGELIVPQNKRHLLKMLLLEAEFYQIEELIVKLGVITKSTQQQQPNESFIESTILPKDQPQFSEKLNEWAGCQSDQKWKLIYKGSKNRFKAPVFHQKCDNQGVTYTIVKSGNSIFGGYNPVPWSSQGGYSNGKDSFLFSLVNIHNIAPTKLRNIDENYGAFNSIEYLPIFGRGNDLILHSDCNVNQNSGNVFRSYENPSNQQFLLTGSQGFKVDEVEVFIRV